MQHFQEILSHFYQTTEKYAKHKNYFLNKSKISVE